MFSSLKQEVTSNIFTVLQNFMDYMTTLLKAFIFHLKILISFLQNPGNFIVLDDIRFLTKSFFHLPTYSQGIHLAIFIKDCNLRHLFRVTLNPVLSQKGIAMQRTHLFVWKTWKEHVYLPNIVSAQQSRHRAFLSNCIETCLVSKLAHWWANPHY